MWQAFINEWPKSFGTRADIARYNGGSFGDWAKAFGNPIPGHFQKSVAEREAERLAKDLKDPVYSIPSGAEAALANAKRGASSRYMSGQVEAQNMIDQNSAKASSDILRSSTGGVDTLAALTKVNANTNAAQNELSYTAARDFDRRQEVLRNQYLNYAGYQDKVFDINTMQKFLRDSAAISALKNSKLHNDRTNQQEAATAGAYAFGNPYGYGSPQYGYPPQSQPVMGGNPGMNWNPNMGPNNNPNYWQWQ